MGEESISVISLVSPRIPFISHGKSRASVSLIDWELTVHLHQALDIARNEYDPDLRSQEMAKFYEMMSIQITDVESGKEGVPAKNSKHYST
jgi:hypothetical protein